MRGDVIFAKVQVVQDLAVFATAKYPIYPLSIKLISHWELGFSQAEHFITFQSGSMRLNNARLYTLLQSLPLILWLSLVVQGWHAPVLPSSTRLICSSTTIKKWKIKIGSINHIALELVGLILQTRQVNIRCRSRSQPWIWCWILSISLKSLILDIERRARKSEGSGSLSWAGIMTLLNCLNEVMWCVK